MGGLILTDTMIEICATATIFNGRLTRIMRQQQKTIIAHKASPHASDMQLKRRESKPTAISVITAHK